MKLDELCCDDKTITNALTMSACKGTAASRDPCHVNLMLCSERTFLQRHA